MYPTFVQSRFEARESAAACGFRGDAVLDRARPCGVRAPDPRHRTRERRQGRRRARAPARAAPAGSPARGADVGRRGPLPARARGGGDRVRRRGADLPPAGARDRRRGRGARAPARAASRATAWCARRSATRRLRVLAPSARAPGFTVAAGELFAELGRSLVTPARFTRALRGGPPEGRRPRTRRSSPRCTRPTTGGSSGLGRAGRAGPRRAALDALRERPAAWGARPVLLYGFDDLDPLQLDAVETLAGRAEAEVVGRAALRGRARGVRRARGDRRAAQAARGAPRRARGPLRALRRARRAARCTTWSGGCSRAARAVLAERRRAAAGGGRRARGGRARGRRGARADARGRRAGGHRGARARGRRRGRGARGGARRLRRPGRAGRAAAAGAHPARRRACSRSPARRSRAAAPRTSSPGCARPASSPTPTPPTRSTRGCGAPRRRRPRTRAACGRARCPSSTRSPRPRRGPAELLEALLAEAEAIWTAPHGRRAAVLGPEDAADARAAAELRSAARELRALAEADPSLLAGDADEVLEALGRGRGPRGRRAAAACSSPTRWRSAPAASAPSSCAGCRTASSRAARRPSRSSTTTPAPSSRAPAGLVLRRHEDVLGDERHLFYACVSRPEEVLFLSFRSSDEEGDPAQPSPFVDDVRALFTDELWSERGTRLLAEVTWPPATAPTPHELRRARAAAERAPEPAAAGRAGAARPCCAALAARGPEAARGAGDVRRLRRALARRVAAQAGPRRSPTRSRCAAARSRTRCSSATLRRPARAHGLGAAGARTRSTPRWRSCDARARASCAAARELRGRPRPRPRCARSRRTSCATCATRPSAAPGWSRAASSGASAARATSHAGAGAQRLGRLGHGPRRPDRRRRRAAPRWCATTRAETVYAGARWARTAGCRPRCTRSPRTSCSGSRRPARCTSRSARGDRRPRGLVRAGTPGRYVNGDVVEPEELEAALREAREVALGAAQAMRAGRIAPVPVALLAQRLRVPGHLPRRRGGRRERRARRHPPAVHRRAARRGRGPHAAPRCWPPTPARARRR